jgi:hypothetical protein
MLYQLYIQWETSTCVIGKGERRKEKGERRKKKREKRKLACIQTYIHGYRYGTIN